MVLDLGPAQAEIARLGKAAFDAALRELDLDTAGPHPDVHVAQVDEAPFPNVVLTKEGCAEISISFEQYLNVQIGPFAEQVMSEVRPDTLEAVTADIVRLLRSDITLVAGWFSVKLVIDAPDLRPWSVCTLLSTRAGMRRGEVKTYPPYVS